MDLFATGSGLFGISTSTEQLIIINLSAILIGTTFKSKQKAIKWGGLIIAVITSTCAIWCNH